jgi:hypothetical protein
MRRGPLVGLLVVCALTWATPTWAAAHVQTLYSNGHNVTTLTTTITTTAGNDVIVTLLLYSTDSTPTQTAGDTLTNTINRTTGGIIQKQYNAHAVAGGSTAYTFTFTSSQSSGLFVTEVSGLSGAFDISRLGQNKGASTTFPTGTATPTQADFCVAVLNLDGGGANSGLSVDSGYTVPTNGDATAFGGVDTMKAATAYLATAGAAGMTFTVASNSAGEAVVGCYKVAAATAVRHRVLTQ